MKKPPFPRCGWRGFALAFLVFLAAPRLLQTAPPAWWQRSGAVVTTGPQNDYAVLNQGQLKSLARAAMEEMDLIVPRGGAGAEVRAMVQGWLAASAAGQGSDFAAVNLGQLKTVARPFYDRLNARNFGIAYPWTAATTDDSDYALATIGQAKTAFRFDLDRDFDADGIPDFKEGIGGKEDGTDIDSDGDGIPDYNDIDSDDDGISDADEIAAGTDPRKRDTDGDGVDDGADAFPTDPNSFLPVKRYAPIDIGAALALPGWYPIEIGINDNNDIAVAYGVGLTHLGIASLPHGSTTPIRATFDASKTVTIPPDEIVSDDYEVMFLIDSITGSGQLVAGGRYQFERGNPEGEWSDYGYLQAYANGLSSYTPARVLKGQTDSGVTFGLHLDESFFGFATFIGPWDESFPENPEPVTYEEFIFYENEPVAGGQVVAGIMAKTWIEPHEPQAEYSHALFTGGGHAGVRRLYPHEVWPDPGNKILATTGFAGLSIAVGGKVGMASHPDDTTPRDALDVTPYYAIGSNLVPFHEVLPANVRKKIQIDNTAGTGVFSPVLNNAGDVFFNGSVKTATGWRYTSLLLVRQGATPRLYEVQGVNSTALSRHGMGFNIHHLFAGGSNLLLPVETVTINAFIPQNNVESPRNYIPFRRNTVFEGDNRMGGTPPRATWNENGSHRTQFKFNMVAWQVADTNGLQDNAYANDADRVQNDEYLIDIGTTREYDQATSLAGGNLTTAARADTVLGDNNLMIKQATAPKSSLWIDWTESGWLGAKKLKITVRSKAENPLVWESAFGPIEYHFTIIIDKTDAAHPTYSLTGEHDGFPAYEIYINHTRVYQHDPLATGEGLGSLGWPMEYDVNATTSHVNQPLP